MDTTKKDKNEDEDRASSSCRPILDLSFTVLRLDLNPISRNGTQTDRIIEPGAIAIAIAQRQQQGEATLSKVKVTHSNQVFVERVVRVFLFSWPADFDPASPSKQFNSKQTSADQQPVTRQKHQHSELQPWAPQRSIRCRR